MRKIRWGVMGCGRISDWFSQGLTVAEGAELYACASRDADKAADFAGRHGFRKSYGSYEELAADSAVDIVYIGTPIRYHAECMELCLRAGRHVLCEKAFTVNAEEARRVIRLSREKGLFLMEAMWTKCLPVFREIMAWAEEGRFGDIRALESVFYNRCAAGHRLFDESIAGGALLDLGVYPITCATALMGFDITGIETKAILSPQNTDVYGTIRLDYSSGAFAQLGCGLTASRRQILYVSGTKGSLLLDNEPFHAPQRAALLDENLQETAVSSHPFRKNGYEYEAEEAMQCLRRGATESRLVPLDQTLRIMEIMDTCRRKWGFRYSFE